MELSIEFVSDLSDRGRHELEVVRDDLEARAPEVGRDLGQALVLGQDVAVVARLDVAVPRSEARASATVTRFAEPE